MKSSHYKLKEITLHRELLGLNHEYSGKNIKILTFPKQLLTSLFLFLIVLSIETYA